MIGARIVVALAVALGIADSGVAAEPFDVMGTLGRRLASAGRAEVRFERIAPNPFGGEPTRNAGRLALEAPDRAELRFPATGERLTLRADGGEWLQPALEQLVRFKRQHASAALRWWQAVLGAQSDDLERHPAGEREWILVAAAAADVPADSIRVRLSADGLPERVEVHEGSETPAVYTFGAWKFVPARGRRAFVVDPPNGYAIVPMP